MGHHQLDTLDEQILQLIADNARIPFLEVARACNVSGAAIHQRIQKLTNLGILKGSEYVIDPEKRWKLFLKSWNVTLLPVNTICLLSCMHGTIIIC